MQTPLLPRVLAAVRHQWILVACIAVLGTAVAFVLLAGSHAKYTATTTVLMVAEPPGLSNPNVPSTATKPLSTADLPSLATNETVVSRLRADLGESATADVLRSRIRAKVSTDSTIMPVQYTAESAAAAVRGANALGDEIVRFYRETATTRFDSLITDFNTQLGARRTQLSVLDGQLTGAAKSYPYVDVNAPGTGNGADSVYSRLIALRSQHEELQATVSSDAAAAAATQRLIDDARPLAERDIVNNDSSYRNVRDQYARDFASLKRMSAFGRGRYPGIVELTRTVQREAATVDAARRNATKSGPAANTTYVAALDAQAKANGVYVGDQAKLSVSSAQLDALNAQIGRGHEATDVARIRRDHQNAETAYATIAGRLANAIADRSEAASTGSVIVLDRARYAPSAAFASGSVVAVGVVLLTIWLALTLAVMIEGSQERFRDARTIEQIYDTELIGSLV